MTPEEQKTWDFMTWVPMVDRETLEYNDDYGVGLWTFGRLKDGSELTVEQLERYMKYFPELLEAHKQDLEEWRAEDRYYSWRAGEERYYCDNDDYND